LLLIGTVMAFGGFVWLSRIQAHSSYIGHVFGPGCIIAGALGVLFTPLASAATAEVPYTEAGLASGVLNTSRQVGGSIGLAVLATVAVDRTHVILARSHEATLPTGHATAVALTAGYARAFVIAALLIATALVSSLVVPSLRSSPRRHSGSEQETEADASEARSAPLPRGAGTAWEPEPA